MKMALVQCNSTTGDIVGNTERILAAWQSAREAGCDVCVTPELALSGVEPAHWLLMPDFMQGIMRALDHLATVTREGPPLLVGSPVPALYHERQFANAAIFVHQGAWQVVSRKVRGQDTLASPYVEYAASCGILTHGGWRLGVVLAEDRPNGQGDFWEMPHAQGSNPLRGLLQRGVDAIVYMAACPWHVGAQRSAERILRQVAARHHLHLFGVNMVGGNDNGVCHGHSLAVAPAGQLAARAKGFAEDFLVVDTATAVPEGAAGNPAVTLRCACDEESIWHTLTLGTRDFVHKCGCEKALLGLSGGMDSALVAAIACEALGAENVLAVLMPSPYSSEGSITDSMELAANLGMHTQTLPIEPAMQSLGQTLENSLAAMPAREGDTTMQNVQSRIRGVLLTALANRMGALVLNTSNKSEAAVGYSTLYGDTVGALAVIGDLTKSQVYAVGRWYNGHRGRAIIPEAIFAKAPSAELAPGQKDSDSLPPYERLDPLLESLLTAPGTAMNTVPLDGPEAREVRRKLFAAEFKRRQEAPPLIISQTPFGSAWRVPVVGRYRPV